MAQFEVYLNPSARSREAIPYLVDIQSDYLAGLATRIVIPLTRHHSVRNTSLESLTPVIEYQDESLLLFTPSIASVPADLLKNPIGSVRHLRARIIGALDFAVTGF